MEEVKDKKNIVLIIVIIIILLFIFFIVFAKPKITLTMNGQKVDKTLEIEYGKQLNIESKSNFIFKDISNKITSSSNVDINTLGEYEIKYSVKVFIYNVNKKLIVKVVDKTVPVITLAGNNPSNTCSIQTYEEEGYEAIDDYDGNLTDKVTSSINENDNEVIYSVEDSSKNKTTVRRSLKVTDEIAPIIKLNGSDNVYVKVNGTYNEQGYTVSDNCDKELSDVKVENKVNTSKIGSYVITYSASDSSGNTSTINRNVYVYDPKTSQNLDGGTKGVIYLTFDDGPSAYTGKILDILKRYDIKATFFVTNNGKDSLIKREYNEGHTVALHTATHSYKKVYSSVDAYFKDLDSVSNRVYKITGEKPTIIRFPGGSSNTISKNYNKGIMTVLTSEVLNRGYHYFDWNISVEDAGGCANKKKDSDKEKCVYNYFVKGLSKNRSNIVLMHDVKYYTANKLEDMIKYALSKGYKFDKITMQTEQIHHRVNN